MSRAESPLRVLSFGAGVQSSYVARMSVIGEIPPFDHVIFADTGDEPAAVYEHMEWWQKRFADEGVSFHVVRKGLAISEVVIEAIENRGKRTPIPLFVQKPDGSKGITQRQCTGDFKIAPIMKKIRELVGVAGKRHTHITDHLVTQIIGISWDEAHRMRDGHYPWIRNEYPLVDRRINRWDCVAEMASDDKYPNAPRSACFHCPYHDAATWRHMRDHQPDDFAKAVALDARLREPGAMQLSNLRYPAYLHSSCRPLSEVDLDNAEDKGQGVLFGNECEGMCGL